LGVRIALGCIVLVAAALRLYGLSPVPDGYQPDEVVTGYDAFALALTGADHHGNHLPLLFESYGDWASPLLTYLTVPFVALGGLSAVTIRLPGVLANVAAIWVVYLLTEEIVGSKIAALAAAFVLATSPWDIALAQFAAPPTLLPLLAALAMLFALRCIRTRSLQDAALFAVSSALLVYDYPTQKLFAPLFVLVVLCCLRGWPERGRVALVFAILVAPMFVVSFADPAYNARFAYVGLNPHDPMFLANVLQRYLEYLNPFFFSNGDLGLSKLMLPYVAGGYALVLSWALFPRRRAGTDAALIRRIGIALSLFILLAPLPASLTIDHQHLNRSVHMLPIVAALVGVAFFVFTAEPFAKRGAWNAVGFAIATLGFLVFSGANTAEFATRYYEGRHLRTGFAERQDGLGTAVVETVKRAAGAPVVIDSGSFNQAYMYYLVVDRYDPRRLPLAQMRASEEPGSWSYVSALDNLRFRLIPADELSRTVELAEMRYGNGAAFEIRSYAGTYYLVAAQAGPALP
jgi:4-amino-4-deoxy-L-arabinose transferase-like glycosyltransferase